MNTYNAHQNATLRILCAAQSAMERAQAQPVYQPRVYAEPPRYAEPDEFDAIDQDADDLIRALRCPGCAD